MTALNSERAIFLSGKTETQAIESGASGEITALKRDTAILRTGETETDSNRRYVMDRCIPDRVAEFEPQQAASVLQQEFVLTLTSAKFLVQAVRRNVNEDGAIPDTELLATAINIVSALLPFIQRESSQQYNSGSVGIDSSLQEGNETSSQNP